MDCEKIRRSRFSRQSSLLFYIFPGILKDQNTTPAAAPKTVPDHLSIANRSPKKISNRPLTPCSQFFNRDPIDRPKRSRWRKKKVVKYSLSESSTYPAIKRVLYSIFSRLIKEGQGGPNVLTGNGPGSRPVQHLLHDRIRGRVRKEPERHLAVSRDPVRCLSPVQPIR